MLWDCGVWGLPVLLLTSAIAGISEASWVPEEVRGLVVTVEEASVPWWEGPSGSKLGCRGVVLIGIDPAPVAVTALVMSGK